MEHGQVCARRETVPGISHFGGTSAAGGGKAAGDGGGPAARLFRRRRGRGYLDGQRRGVARRRLDRRRRPVGVSFTFERRPLSAKHGGSARRRGVGRRFEGSSQRRRRRGEVARRRTRGENRRNGGVWPAALRSQEGCLVTASLHAIREALRSFEAATPCRLPRALTTRRTPTTTSSPTPSLTTTRRRSSSSPTRTCTSCTSRWGRREILLAAAVTRRGTRCRSARSCRTSRCCARGASRHPFTMLLIFAAAKWVLARLALLFWKLPPLAFQPGVASVGSSRDGRGYVWKFHHGGRRRTPRQLCARRT